MALSGSVPTTAGLLGKFYSSSAGAGIPNYANFTSLKAINAKYGSLAPTETAYSTANYNADGTPGTPLSTFNFNNYQSPQDLADFSSWNSRGNLQANANNDALFNPVSAAPFVAIWTGQYNAPTASTYTFNTNSQDGSYLYIDGNLVGNNSPGNNTSGSVTLSAGLHNVELAMVYANTDGKFDYYMSAQDNNGDIQDLSAPSGSMTGFLTYGSTQTFANNVAVTADSNLDLGPNPAATFGNLTISGHTLNVTGSPSFNLGYSLTFGATKFTGNATFNVANNGTNPGVLTLGALSDDGLGPYTISFGGGGTTVLSASAGSLGSGTVINVNSGGTLSLSAAGALGWNGSNPVAVATVNMAAGSTMTLGCQPGPARLEQHGGRGNRRAQRQHADGRRRLRLELLRLVHRRHGGGHCAESRLGYVHRLGEQRA